MRLEIWRLAAARDGSPWLPDVKLEHLAEFDLFRRRDQKRGFLTRHAWRLSATKPAPSRMEDFSRAAWNWNSKGGGTNAAGIGGGFGNQGKIYD